MKICKRLGPSACSSWPQAKPELGAGGTLNKQRLRFQVGLGFLIAEGGQEVKESVILLRGRETK